MTGVFNFFPPTYAAQLDEQLNYKEIAASLTLNQLAGKEWAFAAEYSIVRSRLQDSYPQLPASLTNDGNFTPSQNVNALLQELDLKAIYNRRGGFFGSLEGVMLSQSNGGYSPSLPGDTFWQCNAGIGYHFAQRKATIQLALLNMTDQNYQINPLNPHPYLPRSRTLELSLHFEF